MRLEEVAASYDSAESHEQDRGRDLDDDQPDLDDED
jgi:hypothetical protein